MTQEAYKIIAMILVASLVVMPLVILFLRGSQARFNRHAREEEDRHECQLLRGCDLPESSIKIMLESEGRTYYPPEEE